ncbi:hypothetical protein C8R46DRAFT_1194446 [Mycena filopes]|nr:hypothetical protein C8R46DRAFT_1194446 [Mycena filopes]
MSLESDADEKAREGIWKDRKVVWRAWEPACDTCSLPESLLKGQLLSCAGCLVAKYCTKECQRRDWSAGHKSQCHLYEANRKLSSTFAKSLGPGTIHDPKLSIEEKMVQWNFMNAHNHAVIAAAALKHDARFAATANVAILLSFAIDRAGSKYENRTFFIDRVLLLDRDASNAAARATSWTDGQTDKDYFKVRVGWCLLPGGKTSQSQMWTIPCADALTEVLPPGFDLHRYLTHVNRGITHFHASFWPLSRHWHLSDDDLEYAMVPAGWREYALRHHQMLSILKNGCGLQDHVGYSYPPESKKLLFDSSKMVRLVSNELDKLEQELKDKQDKRKLEELKLHQQRANAIASFLKLAIANK